MQRNPVSSSTIRAVGYDPEKAVLELEFTSGVVYQYTGVGKDTHKGMLEAPSVGKFFATRIRNKYETRKA